MGKGPFKTEALAEAIRRTASGTCSLAAKVEQKRAGQFPVRPFQIRDGLELVANAKTNFVRRQLAGHVVETTEVEVFLAVIAVAIFDATHDILCDLGFS